MTVLCRSAREVVSDHVGQGTGVYRRGHRFAQQGVGHHINPDAEDVAQLLAEAGDAK